MFHTHADDEMVFTMHETNPNAGQRRTFASVLSALIADPGTTYRLRQLIQDDEILRRVGTLSDEVLLARLDTLVREDAAIVGAREVPPGPVVHTAQERADAFVQANAINALEGYQASADDLALQQRVIAGELTSDQAVREIVRRARAMRDGTA